MLILILIYAEKSETQSELLIHYSINKMKFPQNPYKVQLSQHSASSIQHTDNTSKDFNFIQIAAACTATPSSYISYSFHVSFLVILPKYLYSNGTAFSLSGAYHMHLSFHLHIFFIYEYGRSGGNFYSFQMIVTSASALFIYIFIVRTEFC